MPEIPSAGSQRRQEAVIRTKRRFNTGLSLQLSQEQRCHVLRPELIITRGRNDYGRRVFSSLMLHLFTFFCGGFHSALYTRVSA